MPTGLGGSMPQLNRSGETPGPKALFHSVRDIALIKDKTVQAGYGALKSGTIMASNVVTNDLVPYTPTDFGTGDVSRAYLVTDYVTTELVCYVTMADSYKFAVDDSVILAEDSGPSVYHDCSVITGIDRDTEPHRAKVSFTTGVASNDFTTTNTACIYVKAGSASTFSTATYVLDQDIFTGTDADAVGANTSVVISNAILYTGALINCDAAAISDLGMIVDGFHTILK